ncbi:hypothetical protein AWC38_SpisGene12491 [Stylophora pistillata]|uniref:Uncharacterized protein n=1 Tax=Stylophora pistillata TaxID=50429 RepID=A0A2B4RWZ1_STYPI|nr:hypothetical protein AWC38_SpisGene12491 [Stylophora pistillata]
MVIIGRKMALTFTAAALFCKSGLGVTFLTVKRPVLERYQVRLYSIQTCSQPYSTELEPKVLGKRHDIDSGLRELSLISKDDLFLCESGDEIRSLGDRCDVWKDCADHSDERNCNQYYCATEESHGFLWVRAQVGSETLKSCAVANSSWAGIFGSKCMMPYYTVWQHLSTCTCERKSTLESFRNKFANRNDSNFLNVSNDLATAAENGEFTNIRVFHELFIDLFYNVTRSLTPLTVQNAGKALQYCQPSDRNYHVDKALEFLRQAPNDTEAYRFGQIRFSPVREYTTQPNVVDNFRPTTTQVHFVIQRRELFLQLNTAQLLPREVEKPISVPVDNRNTTGNMSTANTTKANSTSAPDGNVVGR